MFSVVVVEGDSVGVGVADADSIGGVITADTDTIWVTDSGSAGSAGSVTDADENDHGDAVPGSGERGPGTNGRTHGRDRAAGDDLRGQLVGGAAAMTIFAQLAGVLVGLAALIRLWRLAKETVG